MTLWTLAAVPVAILVGRAIRIGQTRRTAVGPVRSEDGSTALRQSAGCPTDA
jgi:hypothetical protein